MHLLRFLMLAAFVSCIACNPKSDNNASEQSNPADTARVDMSRKPFFEYHKNGELAISGFMQGGQRVGTWSAWDKDGNKQSEVYYVKGKKNGEYKIWHKNGQIRVLGAYDMGQPSGTWKTYDDQGNPLAEKQYD